MLIMNFNKVLEHLGHFGVFQLCIYFLACIAQLLSGIHMLAGVFLLDDPKHRCFVDLCDNKTSKYNESWVSFTIPKTEDGSFSQCNHFSLLSLNSTYGCTKDSFSSSNTTVCNKWVWDDSEFSSTAITEWNIVCKKSWNAASSQSIFMAGGLIGASISGYVSDRVGRKTVFMGTSVLLLVSGICTAFAPNFSLFTALRFFTAVAVCGLFQTGYIIAVEFIGTSKRVICANVMQIVFAIGELLLGLAAYFFHDWKKLQMAISIPAVILLSYYWFLPESVRWLISKGKHQKARNTILKAASWNKVKIPDHLLRSPSTENLLGSSQENERSGPLDLWRNKKLRKWSLFMFIIWIVNSLVYYGLSLSASNLSGSTLVNFVILAAVEIPAVTVATAVLHYSGRRPVLCLIMVFGGLCCGGTAFIPKSYAWLATTLAVFGKSAIAASFAIIYVYSAEIYPTVLRSTGIGMSSMFARIGGIIAPLISELRRFYHPLPMLVFGISAILAGFIALLLPETHQKLLPETIADSEDLSDNCVSIYQPSEPSEVNESLYQRTRRQASGVPYQGDDENMRLLAGDSS